MKTCILFKISGETTVKIKNSSVLYRQTAIFVNVRLAKQQ
jgi:hypothetical protein